MIWLICKNSKIISCLVLRPFYMLACVGRFIKIDFNANLIFAKTLMTPFCFRSDSISSSHSNLNQDKLRDLDSLTKTPRFTSLFASKFSLERALFSETRLSLTRASLAEANEPLLLHFNHVLV